MITNLLILVLEVCSNLKHGIEKPKPGIYFGIYFTLLSKTNKSVNNTQVLMLMLKKKKRRLCLAVVDRLSHMCL